MFRSNKPLPKNLLTACLSTGEVAGVTLLPPPSKPVSIRYKRLTLTCGLFLKKWLKNRLRIFTLLGRSRWSVALEPSVTRVVLSQQ